MNSIRTPAIWSSLPNLICSISLAADPVISTPIEEVIVTAQRKAEPLRVVPISVSAFDSNSIRQKQLDVMGDLQYHTPNVSYSRTNFARSDFQIRGVGSLVNTPTADYGVAMHLNDVFLNAPAIAETEFYDLERIEVLRGPQGTLYGRNATGGVVNLRTARPVPGELDSEIELQLGNYDHQRVSGALNLPLAERVTVRLAGVWVDRDGYVDNVYSEETWTTDRNGLSEALYESNSVRKAGST